MIDEDDVPCPFTEEELQRIRTEPMGTLTDQYADGRITKAEMFRKMRAKLYPRPSWAKLRKAVWERDNGICGLCVREIESIDDYECGHIIDRCAYVLKEPDTLDNLTAMHVVCNRLKPVHKTREEYEDFRRSLGFASRTPGSFD